VTIGHGAYLCRNPSAFQTLVVFNSKGELGNEVQRLKTTGEILILQPGTHVRFLEYKDLTPNGLVRPYPTTGGEPNIFPVRKVRVSEGPQSGVEGWVFAADVKLKYGPPL
jgi:hypothetical protein